MFLKALFVPYNNSSSRITGQEGKPRLRTRHRVSTGRWSYWRPCRVSPPALVWLPSVTLSILTRARYWPGLKLFELGSKAIGLLDLRAQARPLLDRLQERTQEIANLAGMDRSDVLGRRTR